MDSATRDRLSAHLTCTSCTDCCCNRGTPLVTREERDLIVAFSKKNFLVNTGQFFEMNQEPCPYFLNQACSIQPVKPLVCVAWPVTLKARGADDFEVVLVRASSCAVSAIVGKDYIREAAAQLQSMPVEYKRATAALTEKFGFPVGPVESEDL